MNHITRDISLEIAKNVAMSIPAVRRWRLRQPRAGARFTGQDAELERYAFQSLRAVLRHRDVSGAKVLEIGPGDYLTSGLALLGAGAASYTSVDRFVGDFSQLEGKEWYTGIELAWPRIFPEYPWPAIDGARFPEDYPELVSAHDLPVEEIGHLGEFDVICSFQVGEHVSDIDLFARANATMLAPGGVAVHRIDFGPHGAWRANPDPLAFLRVPDPLWRLASARRGLPNRLRLNETVAAFESAGLDVEVSGIEQAPESSVQWDRLGRRYRDMPRDSVRTVTALLVCRHHP